MRDEILETVNHIGKLVTSNVRSLRRAYDTDAMESFVLQIASLSRLAVNQACPGATVMRDGIIYDGDTHKVGVSARKPATRIEAMHFEILSIQKQILSDDEERHVTRRLTVITKPGSPTSVVLSDTRFGKRALTLVLYESSGKSYISWTREDEYLRSELGLTFPLIPMKQYSEFCLTTKQAIVYNVNYSGGSVVEQIKRLNIADEEKTRLITLTRLQGL
tara:strand:- start:10500 stop:11156 length:657 start_codon:yes stop_codon:yes gene_type:complete